MAILLRDATAFDADSVQALLFDHDLDGKYEQGIAAMHALAGAALAAVTAGAATVDYCSTFSSNWRRPSRDHSPASRGIGKPRSRAAKAFRCNSRFLCRSISPTCRLGRPATGLRISAMTSTRWTALANCSSARLSRFQSRQTLQGRLLAAFCVKRG